MLLNEVRSLKKHVTCPICLEYFNKPITLNCQHSFCQECMRRVFTNNPKCPLCNYKISSVLSFKELQFDDIICSIKDLVKTVDRDDVSPVRSAVPNLSVSSNENFPVNLLKDHLSNLSKSTLNIESDFIDNSSKSHTTATTEQVTFEIGQVVNVLPRTWIGINKPGGAAWIKCNDGENTYTVKYILGGGHDTKVPSIFIEKSVELERTTRRRSSLSSYKDTVDTTEPVRTKRKSQKSLDESIDNHVNLTNRTTKNDRNKKSKSKQDNTNNNLELNCENNKKVILTSTIPSEISIILENLEKKYSNIKVVHRFDDSVTHLIVAPDNKGILHYRTMKYLQGIINGIWILTIDWIIDCMKQNCILAENNYELIHHSKSNYDYVPKKARENFFLIKQNKCKKLFHNVAVCLYGSFPNPGPPKSDIKYLLDKGGAIFESNVYNLINHQDQTIKIVICADINVKDELDKIITNLNNQSRCNIKVINAIWVLDCITNYHIMDINKSDYSII